MEKKRIYYSKNFKRFALVEISKGNKLEDILRSEGFDTDSLIQKDKKYFAKLLYKWKEELYQNNELIYFLNSDKSEQAIKYELENLNFNNNKDPVMSDINEKILSRAERYKNLKNRILNKYQRKTGKF